MADGLHSDWSYMEQPLRASPALGRGPTEFRGQQALVFQSIQRDIDGAAGNVAPDPTFDVVANRRSIGAFAAMQRGHENYHFKLAQGSYG